MAVLSRRFAFLVCVCLIFLLSIKKKRVHIYPYVCTYAFLAESPSQTTHTHTTPNREEPVKQEHLYFDEETQRYFASSRDAERIKLFVKLKEGELYPVQGFTRYTITSEGEVLNIRRARPVRPFLNGSRLAIALINDQGRQTTVSLARLVASHFIPIPDEDQYYDACYKDGDIRNVHPSNLYWEPRWRRHANPDNYGVDIT